MKPIALLITIFLSTRSSAQDAWIRINQLGYANTSAKVAVWCSGTNAMISSFELVDAVSGKTVYTAQAGKPYGAYGPFATTYRLDFSAFRKKGTYFLKAGEVRSPAFPIGDDVYKGTADFCLRYMRQQRSGFNPFLKDSCHTHDGYTLYGPMADSSFIDVSGGWHDASDYLQYSTTSANATFHLLAAYRDFPAVFGDEKQANGLDGKNGVKDVLDEARWGIDWLLKMNPRKDWMFNQLGDDRDHMGMRIPKEDSFYGRGYQRPVYFNSGKPQQRGKFMNATTGTASTAGKFAGAFALGAELYAGTDQSFSKLLSEKAADAWHYGLASPGVAQTASVRSPYIYAEEDWMDDMELAAAQLYTLTGASEYRDAFYRYLRKDTLTKWMGKDTASHYQYYPFNNLAVYAMARKAKQATPGLMQYYAEGLQKVQDKAAQNAFNRGIPFIWCSNNLTVSFAIQCYWYRVSTGDTKYAALEQACFDWLFGCNPWGTSMVYGLPAGGDTPEDPHSAFTNIKQYPIDGGLVDGPVYTNIYKNLIGITLNNPDEYARFQSDLAVYHDDYGDYSTNEPTMDGTASLIYLLAAKDNEASAASNAKASAARTYRYSEGVMIRGDSSKKQVALVFTGDEFGEGLETIAKTLDQRKLRGSFFFTGRLYRNPQFRENIQQLYKSGHLMGSHSDQHLLYNDWTNRNHTLVTRDSLLTDLANSRAAMRAAGIPEKSITDFYIPPYEWWNAETARWLSQAGMRSFSFTPGTISNADYTYPEMGRSYRSSEEIIQHIRKMAAAKEQPLNGAILLIHAGTDDRRKDKLYNRLNELITGLQQQGYVFKRIDEML